MRKILSKWYIYLISFAVVITSFCVLTYVKTNPKKEERINFVLGSFDANINAIENTLNSSSISNIKDVRCNFLRLYANNFNYLFSSLRSDSDFFILPIDYMNKNFVGASDYAANINKEYVDEQLGKEQTYYSVGECVKGIKIFDAETSSGMLKDYITYIEGEEKSDYYLFFTFNSANIGKLNNSKSENAFRIIEKMMSL